MIFVFANSFYQNHRSPWIYVKDYCRNVNEVYKDGWQYSEQIENSKKHSKIEAQVENVD